VPLGAGHRAGERAEAPVADAVQAGQVGVADGELRQAGSPAAEVGRLDGGDSAVDRLMQAAVRRDQVRHHLSFGTPSGCGGAVQIWYVMDWPSRVRRTRSARVVSSRMRCWAA